MPAAPTSVAHGARQRFHCRAPGCNRRSSAAESGFTLLELLIVLSLTVTAIGVALPLMGEAIDELRTAGAARYLAARISGAHVEALTRSAAVALRFEPGPADEAFQAYVDGNGNGIRTVDIQRGIDSPLTMAERLADNFPGVRFELMSGVPDADGASDGRLDGVRVGASRILTLSPDGSSSSGTLYVRGRRAQYAVRVLGVTGRTRVLQYDSGGRKWISR